MPVFWEGLGFRVDVIFNSTVPGEAMKMDFAPYIEQLFPPMLMGITGTALHFGRSGHGLSGSCSRAPVLSATGDAARFSLRQPLCPSVCPSFWCLSLSLSLSLDLSVSLCLYSVSILSLSLCACERFCLSLSLSLSVSVRLLWLVFLLSLFLFLLSPRCQTSGQSFAA